jgi:hypothetical protein
VVSRGLPVFRFQSVGAYQYFQFLKILVGPTNWHKAREKYHHDHANQWNLDEHNLFSYMHYLLFLVLSQFLLILSFFIILSCCSIIAVRSASVSGICTWVGAFSFQEQTRIPASIVSTACSCHHRTAKRCSWALPLILSASVLRYFVLVSLLPCSHRWNRQRIRISHRRRTTASAGLPPRSSAQLIWFSADSFWNRAVALLLVSSLRVA